MVNKFLKISPPPGPWVDEVYCSVCKETYDSFKPGITFFEAANLVRQHNKEDGGGFRSRGPILWAMRVLKTSAWFEKHQYCGQYEENGD